MKLSRKLGISGQSWTLTTVATGSLEWKRPQRSPRVSKRPVAAMRARTFLHRSRCDTEFLKLSYMSHFTSMLAEGFFSHQMPVNACFKFYLQTSYSSDRILFPYYKSGVPGYTGIWSGSSDSPSLAGRVLFQWTGQKLVISSPVERWHDIGGESCCLPHVQAIYRSRKFGSVSNESTFKSQQEYEFCSGVL